jgi:cysteinyl-tRNA synthetase
MAMKFYNTLTRRKESFKPLKKKKVGIYSCGPTVYGFAHIGNYRAYVFEDVLCRLLRARGYQVHQIMNITDVDDKTIRGSMDEGKTLSEYTQPFREVFFGDLKTLHIEPAECYPLATQHIPQMIEIAEKLLRRGLAYESEGSIYFRISKFPEYGKLSRMDLEQVQSAERMDQDEYEKEEARDFCLWKAAREGEPFWESPFGRGRPGWHLECSAMSMHYLGAEFDIHTGGEDNIFPHHENEIAQSEGVMGKPFVRNWMHCKFLIVDGQKMSKSKGNCYTLRDLLQKGYTPLAIRYLLLSAHYRSVLNFTFSGLEQAQKTLERLYAFMKRLRDHRTRSEQDSSLEEIQAAQKAFEEALDDDLNVPQGLAVLFDLIRSLNQRLETGRLGQKDRKVALKFFEDANKVLGIFSKPDGALDQKINQMVREREGARKRKDFKTADRLRKRILELGIILEDTGGTVRWRRKLDGENL